MYNEDDFITTPIAFDGHYFTFHIPSCSIVTAYLVSRAWWISFRRMNRLIRVGLLELKSEIVRERERENYPNVVSYSSHIAPKTFTGCRSVRAATRTIDDDARLLEISWVRLLLNSRRVSAWSTAHEKNSDAFRVDSIHDVFSLSLAYSSTTGILSRGWCFLCRSCWSLARCLLLLVVARDDTQLVSFAV